MTSLPPNPVFEPLERRSKHFPPLPPEQVPTNRFYSRLPTPFHFKQWWRSLKMASLKRLLPLLLLTGPLLGLASAGIGLKPLDFFRFSDEDLGREVAVVFHPDEGLRLRETFEKKYGARGEELIKVLGEGVTSVAGMVKAPATKR